jgi:SAM-dependent methyltransferase
MSAPDLLADARVLWHMLRGQPRGGDHAQRLAAFYAPQAEHYDAFRARLLQGRRELIQKLAPPPRAHIVELGCGTGANLVHFGDGLAGLGRVDLVDLCPPLLEQARRRTARLGNVRVIEADACSYAPGRLVDCVYFSYSLTMIPDWSGALASSIFICPRMAVSATISGGAGSPTMACIFPPSTCRACNNCCRPTSWSSAAPLSPTCRGCACPTTCCWAGSLSGTFCLGLDVAPPVFAATPRIAPPDGNFQR